MQTALITGVAGQDGSYLAELLLERGFRVVGVEREARRERAPNLAQIEASIEVVSIDLTDPAAVRSAFERFEPTQVFHLAGASFVPTSWLHPTPIVSFASASTAALLDAIVNGDRSIRFFQAASAEVFGRPLELLQSETTPILPVTPYGAGKAMGLFLTRMYRERFGLHASCGILFNHESPRRPTDFVTRKITHAAAAIARGDQSELQLGSLDSRRDWSFAGDIVSGIAAMVDHDAPGDYVLASGTTHSIRDVLDIAFGHVGLTWQDHVAVDEALVRPTEATTICGDPAKAERELNWTRAVGFQELIEMMVEADVAAAAR